MKLSFGGVFADAGAMWRANHEILLAVAGIFFFLPVFAFDLFVPILDVRGLADDARIRAVAQWYGTNGVWLVLPMALQFFGSAVVLSLLLDAGRPTVAQAIARVVHLLPALVIAMLGSALLIGGGTVLFFVPGMYAFGRCYIVWAVIVAEPGRGGAEGFLEALRRTRGLGWRLFALGMTVVIPLYLVLQILGTPAAGSGAIGTSVLALCGAALGSVAGIGQLLLQAAAYRALRHGI